MSESILSSVAFSFMVKIWQVKFTSHVVANVIWPMCVCVCHLIIQQHHGVKELIYFLNNMANPNQTSKFLYEIDLMMLLKYHRQCPIKRNQKEEKNNSLTFLMWKHNNFGTYARSQEWNFCMAFFVLSLAFHHGWFFPVERSNNYYIKGYSYTKIHSCSRDMNGGLN